MSSIRGREDVTWFVIALILGMIGLIVVLGLL